MGECLCLYAGLYSLVNDDLLGGGDLVLLRGDLGELRDLLCVQQELCGTSFLDDGDLVLVLRCGDLEDLVLVVDLFRDLEECLPLGVIDLVHDRDLFLLDVADDNGVNELLGVVAGDLLLLDVVDNGVLLFVLLHLLDGRYEGEGDGLDVAGVKAGDLLDLFPSVLVVDVLLEDLLDLLVGRYEVEGDDGLDVDIGDC